MNRPESPPAKVPKVFLDHDQKALDDAYDQAVYAPNRNQVNSRLAAASRLARERLGAPRREAYGPTAIERLDIYRTRVQSAPVVVFIHGGAWQSGTAEDHAYAAEVFLHAGLKRNFQMMSRAAWLELLCRHIPDRYEHDLRRARKPPGRG